MAGSILFICGSLNAGKNGVGDYTRLIASLLQAQGYVVSIIASHDHEIDNIVEEQQGERAEIATLRISRKVAHEIRWKAINLHVAVFDPEVISLQYVPYSFDTRGFPYRFVQEITRAPFRSRKWHIMFHEMWVGWETRFAPKRRLLSLGQQWLVKKLYRLLQPVLVHTHLPAYIDDLAGLGITALPLPLFANVATGDTRHPVEQAPLDGVFRLGFFSQMDISPPLANFISDLLSQLPARHNGKIEIVLIGGNQIKISATQAKLAEQFPGLRIIVTGFLSNEEVLGCLESIHLGITPIPLHVLGKSGTVAAFLTQRIPMAAPKVTKKSPPFLFQEFNDAVITTFTPEAFTDARRAVRDLPTNWIAPETVTHKFLQDLQKFGLLSRQSPQKTIPS